MNISQHELLTFDDVLLVPKHSTVPSRSQVKLDVSLPKNFKVSSPLMPANMKDVVDITSATTFVNRGCLTLSHRFCDINEQINFITTLQKHVQHQPSQRFGCSLGVSESQRDHAEKLYEVGCRIFCIDVAHGDSVAAIEMTRYVAKNFPDSLVISGNVATANAATRLWEAGADVVKVGIGPGSICTTRKETGNGVPQLSALDEISTVKKLLELKLQRKLAIIADGGIKSSGDCVKALCFADLVMIGGLFSATYEAPGQKTVLENGIVVKNYHGSSTHKLNRVEGTQVTQTVNNHLWDVIDHIHEGIQSGCSYQNAHHVSELQQDPIFVRVTSVQQALDQNKTTFRR